MSTETFTQCLGQTVLLLGLWYLGRNLMVTASIDQRVCVWAFTVQDSNIKVNNTFMILSFSCKEEKYQVFLRMAEKV